MIPQNGKATIFTALFIGLGVILLLLIVIFSFVSQATLPAQGALSTTIFISTRTQSFLTLQQERDTIEAAVMQTHMALIETVTPISPPTCCPLTDTQIPFVSGIYDVPFIGELRGSSFLNRWQSLINGERVLVFAGALRESSGTITDKATGIVAVKVYSKDLSNISGGIYEAPVPTGLLKIMAANGYQLTLLGQNGLTLYFDVPTRRFLSDPNIKIVAPTTTPLPLITQTSTPLISGSYEISYAPVCYPPGRANCTVTSFWQDIINNERVEVYAGASVDFSGATPDKTQGIVIVDVLSKDLSNWNIVKYEAPGKTGLLKIVAANGYRLTLLGQNGATLYFDVPTRQFMSDPNIKIAAPTTTPLPPITQTSTPLIPLGYPPPLWTPASLDYPQPSTNTPISSALP